MRGSKSRASWPEALRQCWPQDKHDVAAAERLVRLDPTVLEPCFFELLGWLKDINWPVAHVVAPFFAGLGKAAVPAVRRMLQGHDTVWQYFVLTAVLSHWPTEAVAQLREPLERLATCDDGSEADIAALGLLIRHRLGDAVWLNRWLAFKIQGLENRLEEMRQIERAGAEFLRGASGADPASAGDP